MALRSWNPTIFNTIWHGMMGWRIKSPLYVISSIFLICLKSYIKWSWFCFDWRSSYPTHHFQASSCPSQQVSRCQHSCWEFEGRSSLHSWFEKQEHHSQWTWLQGLRKGIGCSESLRGAIWCIRCLGTIYSQCSKSKRVFKLHKLDSFVIQKFFPSSTKDKLSKKS